MRRTVTWIKYNARINIGAVSLQLTWREESRHTTAADPAGHHRDCDVVTTARLQVPIGEFPRRAPDDISRHLNTFSMFIFK